MSLYKRDGSPFWWIRLTIDGRVVQQSSRTADKREARRLERKLTDECREVPVTSPKARRTWDEAVIRYVGETSENPSHDDDLAHLRWLSPFLKGKFLDEIKRDVLDEIMNRKKATGVSNATVNRCMQVASRILRKAAIDWEWIDRAQPVRKLPEPKLRIRYLTREEANRLIGELPEHLALMMRFALATGLRQANVKELLWSQVNLITGHCWIHADQSKSGYSMGIPLSDEAVEVLRECLGRHSTHVFTYKGKPVKQVSGKAWWAALERAGIENFRWHDLRHTWASWHVQEGTPMLALKELGGWKTLEMVQKYAHLGPDHLARFANAASIRGSELERNVTTF